MSIERLQDLLMEADEIVSQIAFNPPVLTEELLEETAGQDEEQMLLLLKWVCKRIEIEPLSTETKPGDEFAIVSGRVPDKHRFVFRDDEGDSLCFFREHRQ